jgi:hypothetical protein
MPAWRPNRLHPHSTPPSSAVANLPLSRPRNNTSRGARAVRGSRPRKADHRNPKTPEPASLVALKAPNSLLAGKMQGILSVRPLLELLRPQISKLIQSITRQFPTIQRGNLRRVAGNWIRQSGTFAQISESYFVQELFTNCEMLSLYSNYTVLNRATIWPRIGSKAIELAPNLSADYLSVETTVVTMASD